ncbi:hypothetical protein [Microcoleus sp.]|uniref:hypothetical protein n=1 Tax=Microcoleus sp. TaxID=44472 RepID=UPI0035256169
MPDNLDKFNVLARTQELVFLVEEHDRADQESDLVLFAEHDPLKNLKQALAEKLSFSTGNSLSECHNEAEKIVNQIRQEITKPTAKTRICSTLKLLSGDFSNLSVGVVSSVLATLITGGVISLPVIPALPGIVVGVGALVITRAGIEFICSGNSEGDK